MLAAATDSSLMPLWLLLIGIASVLGMIIGFKLNAFLALIISALIVSLGVGWMDGQDAADRMSAVVDAFGSAAGAIGIAIAMAAIIGKCMLDSGAADRIVRGSVRVTGEKHASLGLALSGFVLAIPVFFDTVFYLLVPLARSLYQRTNKNYLRYLMAITTGGAITHTLVPPTPGPLLVAAILGVDIGVMMLMGTLIAVPAAVAGLGFSIMVDRKMPIVMRPLVMSEDKHQPLLVGQLPSLGVSLLPVILPVVLIGIGTLLTTVADREDLARLSIDDIINYDALAEVFAEAVEPSPARQLLSSEKLTEDQRELLVTAADDSASKQAVVDVINDALLDEDFYEPTAFLGVPLSKLSQSMLDANQLRMKPVDRRRMNRALLEDAFPELIRPHFWESKARTRAMSFGLFSNPNFALMLAAVCAMLTLKRVRQLSWRALGEDVEQALMSGGVIILITSAGGAFGGMLQDTQISEVIKSYFAGRGAAGIGLLLLGWGIAAVLKVAQGSSTVAMIVGAGMMSAIIGNQPPDYHLVYVAAAVGTGSLMGSWMNDSGFWIYTKMGALTEEESLKSWTLLLMVLSIVGFATTLLLSVVMPLKVIA